MSHPENRQPDPRFDGTFQRPDFGPSLLELANEARFSRLMTKGDYASDPRFQARVHANREANTAAREEEIAKWDRTKRYIFIGLGAGAAAVASLVIAMGESGTTIAQPTKRVVESVSHIFKGSNGHAQPILSLKVIKRAEKQHRIPFGNPGDAGYIFKGKDGNYRMDVVKDGLIVPVKFSELTGHQQSIAYTELNDGKVWTGN
jgi:hypothetical protein